MIDYIVTEIWGIVGLVVSVVGLLIAIIQLRQIANRTKLIDETYKQTIKDVENRDIITNISTALQKVESLKRKIIENNIDIEMIYHLSPLSKVLVILNNGLKDRIQDTNLDAFKVSCNELEIRIITSNERLTKNDLKNDLVILSDLELRLTEIQSNLRYNRNI